MIVLTGASGFIGQAFVETLTSRGKPFLALSRNPRPGFKAIGDIADKDDWSQELRGASAVIHLAARAHVRKEQAADPADAYRRTNVAATERLARAAAECGVKRLVFISSIAVNGKETQPGRPFTEQDAPAPVDLYGISKLQAEQALRQIAQETGLEVVSIRPPLVYGPNVPSNFRAMMQWIAKGVPLPLGAVGNLRTLCAVDNLVDLALLCVEHEAAAGQTFLVGDGEDLSTTDLLRRVGRFMGRPARLVPVPASLLWLGARLLRREAVARQLLASLQLDLSNSRRLLGWTPPVGVDDALRRTARHFTGGGSSAAE
jgi:nucleoside-diphosphate-sugar epimerase